METIIIFNECTLTGTTENTYILRNRMKCASIQKAIFVGNM